jgi:NAD+ diphosphatase
MPNHQPVLICNALDFVNFPLSVTHKLSLGYFEDQPCELWLIRKDGAAENRLLESGWMTQSLRALFAHAPVDVIPMAMRALQLSHWFWHHQYCGRCGAPIAQPAAQALFMHCTHCQADYYPQISPCVIGLVVRGDECLLAHNTRFSDDTYSTLAGFIEPGETAEQAFAREVYEETQVEIEQIAYFGSQPWPFPSQLMIGFIAQYKTGQIRVDGQEIDRAAWFHRDHLPKIPPEHSISGKIIRYFMTQMAQPD